VQAVALGRLDPTASADTLAAVTTAELSDADRRVLWHPFTQHRDWEDELAPIIERGQGTTIYDTDGTAYIDGVSSLWCNIHGHRHPHIDAAIHAQVDRISHSTMLGLSHPPAIELAQRLVEIAPSPSPDQPKREPLTRVFYSDSGSTAVEIALKMAFQSFAQNGQQQRSSFICLRDAYHGDTIGSVSVGGIDLFHSLYRPLLFDAWQADSGDAGSMAELLEKHGHNVAAVIVEPLIQGAAGMLVHPPGYLKRVRELCDAHGVLMICDEVATGFGRTGRMFACEHEGVVPDLLCLAKGITGGYLPLAATLATESVYRSFLGEHEDYRTFFHGHTYTGNPLACAAAIASLEVFEQERTLERVQTTIALLADYLDHYVKPLGAVVEIRRVGLMTGIALSDSPARERLGHQVTLAARRRGAIVRPLGDVIVLMPPLSISDSELEQLVRISADAIAEVTQPSPATTGAEQAGQPSAQA